MKYVVYYRVPNGTRINRAYPELPNSASNASAALLEQTLKAWLRGEKPGATFVDYEEHSSYTVDYQSAGMVGADPDDVRDWLEDRIKWLAQRRQQAAQAQAAKAIPGTGDGYGGLPPGTIVRDQNGRSGRVPQVPLEVFRHKPISPDSAMDAVRDFCKGGGGTIPRGA